MRTSFADRFMVEYRRGDVDNFGVRFREAKEIFYHFAARLTAATFIFSVVLHFRVSLGSADLNEKV